MIRKIFPNKPIKLDFELFTNQDEFGKNIAYKFLDLSILSALAIAPTQSGKTGSMLALIKHMCRLPTLSMPLQHIFIITGHSSIEWLEQTKNRFPSYLHHRIYHRNNLKNFADDIKDIRSALVIIDENQIASSEGQTIHKSFDIADIMNVNSLYDKDIKVVQFTATPLNVSDFDNRYSFVITMTPSDKYVSIRNLLEQGRVKQYKDLCGKLPFKDYSKVSWKCPKTFIHPPKDIIDNITEILDFITISPQFHIIRTPPSYLHDVVISNFIQVFGDSFIYISELDIDDLDDTLLHKPKKHSFIFIKEKLRCAKTIPKQYLGVLYERVSASVNDHVIIQGLAGRLTGYHDNFHAVVFTNILSIRRYLEHLDNGFDGSLPKYRSFTFIDSSKHSSKHECQ